jgi:ribose transport system ATP-binding protein
MEDIRKTYPGVRALKGVSFHLQEGEIHALVGENGAGKSTLIKILSGAITKDSGTIIFDGEHVEILNPYDARRLGISTIYQEFSLAPHRTVAENIFLGREPFKNKVLGTIDRGRMNEVSRDLLESLGSHIDPEAQIKDLSVSDKQEVEIAKALSVNSKIIVMDEPTSALSKEEVEKLFDILRALKKKQVSVIYISHHLDEIFSVADRATVFKDGDNVGTITMTEADIHTLIKMMVGKEWRESTPEVRSVNEKEVLKVEALSDATFVNDVTFSVKKGEILGITGTVGSGRTELAKAIFGANRKRAGKIYLHGNQLDIRCPGDAIKYGIGYLSEDRKTEGLNLKLSIRDNIVLSAVDKLSRYGMINQKEKTRVSQSFIEALRIKVPGMTVPVAQMSGGNQQKVVLAKWLFTGCKILFFDEPTRGIDIGAKAEVHELIRDFVNQDGTAIVISSDIHEILSVCDRILVMRAGRIVGDLKRLNASKETILSLATGGN